MAQRITMPPAEVYSRYAMSPEHPRTSGDVLIDVVEGSDSDHDHHPEKRIFSTGRKRQFAPIVASFHCWTLTKAAPRTRDDALSWKRAERVQMTLSSDELGSQVKKQLKIRSLTEMYEALSMDQRQQVEVLLKEKRRDETNKYACWEIAAIHREVRNNMRTRIRETTFIRVILSREDKRKVESAATEHKATKASSASNISDLNNLPELLLRPVEKNDDQDAYARRKEFNKRPKVKKDSREDVIEVVAVPSIESPLAINVPPTPNTVPSDQLQHYPAWSNRDTLWQPSIDHGHEYTAQHLNQCSPQQAINAQQTQQPYHIQNALPHMVNMNQDTRTEMRGERYEQTWSHHHNHHHPSPWLAQQPPALPRAFGYDSHDMPTQQHSEGVATHESPSIYKSRPTSSEQDYFGQQFERPYAVVAEPFFAQQPQNPNGNVVPLVTHPYSEGQQARRASPSAKIQVSSDSDWPDYDPTTDQSPLPTLQPHQHTTYDKQSAGRSRREDVLFWRTQTQLSDSHSASSLDDQSSTLASPEQSSPLTSVSGDGTGVNHKWTNEPASRYDENTRPVPERFGKQLAAHDFLRPHQDRQREQTPVPPRRTRNDYRPSTDRNVSFEDVPFQIPDVQNAPPHTSTYYPEAYARPSAPDPPKAKANFQTYHPQRYQPSRQYTEPENASMLESLSERLDNMELRQAESATRRAVEAAQKRREAEKKEAYERGIEDAMAWKARSGRFGGFD
ncbi:hypothetical protein M436DRAFT_44755 [Aureobasidium namibiae CBS 147.97]|uniref:Uncharacterized protein n=1 Tax=Aureobasidium namibiae CBS 147.97 TaxID=1043004 RepID=A0A074XHA1_9PEZI